MQLIFNLHQVIHILNLQNTISYHFAIYPINDLRPVVCYTSQAIILSGQHLWTSREIFSMATPRVILVDLYESHCLLSFLYLGKNLLKTNRWPFVSFHTGGCSIHVILKPTNRCIRPACDPAIRSWSRACNIGSRILSIHSRKW